MIHGVNTIYYRHPIRGFSFTELDGKEKWSAYKFTKNLYDTWMPAHFRRICSVIDDLPAGVNFDLSQQSELQFTESFGLSQELESYSIVQSSASSQHSQMEGGYQSSGGDNQDITPNPSVTEKGPFQRPRRERIRGGRQ